MDGWNENAPLQPEVGRPGFNEDTTNGFKPLNPFRPISTPDHFQQQAQQAAQDQGGYYQPGPGQMYNQPWSAPLSPAQPMMPPQAPYGPGGMQSGFTGGFQPSGGFQPVGGAPVPGGQPMPVQGGYQSFPPMFTAPLQPAGYGQQYPQQGAPVQPLQNMPPQAAPMQSVPSYSGPMQPVNPYAAQAPSGPYAPVNPAQQPMQGVSPYSGPMQPVQGMPPYGVPPMQPAAGYPVQDPAMQPVPGEQPPAQPEAPQPEPNPWNDLPPYPGMEAGANGAAAPEAPQAPQAYQEPVQPIQEPPRAADPPEEPAAPKDSDPLGIPPYLRNTSRMRKTPNLPPLKKPEATETPAAQKPEEPVYNDDIYQRPAPVQPETPAPAEATAEAGRTVLMPPDRPRRRSHAGSAAAEPAAAPQPAAVQPQPPADPPPGGQATRRRRSHHDVQDAQSAEGSAVISGGAASSSDAGECHPFVNQAGAEDTGVDSGSVRPVPACDNDSSADSAPRQRRSGLHRPALILRSTSPVYRADPEDAEYQQPAPQAADSRTGGLNGSVGLGVDAADDPAFGLSPFADPDAEAPEARPRRYEGPVSVMAAGSAGSAGSFADPFPDEAGDDRSFDPSPFAGLNAGSFAGNAAAPADDAGDGDDLFIDDGDPAPYAAGGHSPFPPSPFTDLNAPAPEVRPGRCERAAGAAAPFAATPADSPISSYAGGFGDSPFTDLSAEAGGDDWSPFSSAAASGFDAAEDSGFPASSPAGPDAIDTGADWSPFDAAYTPESFLSGGEPLNGSPTDPDGRSSAFSQSLSDGDPLPGWDPFGSQPVDDSLFTDPAALPEETPDMPLSSDALSELFSGGAQGSEKPAYGASSYDAGAMPNPSLGDLPYAAVSTFRTENKPSVSQLNDVSAGVPDPDSGEVSPEDAPTPLGESSAPKADPEPSAGKPAGKASGKPPIKLSRLFLLLTAAGMLLFCIAVGGRMLIAFVQNTDEVAQLSSGYYSATGQQLSEAGETVDLNQDGTTFPPGNSSGEGVYHGILTGQDGQQQGGQSASGEASAGKRTRLSEYPLSQRFTIMPIIEEQRKITPDAVGKLTIPGLLEEWIVSKEDVTYYLNHNIHNQSNYYGAVFLEQHRALEKPPENLHLRGSDAVSSTGDGSVFHKLWQYKEGGSTFTMAHNRATVITLHEQIDFELIAVIEASLNPARPDYFNYFGQLSFQSDAAMMDYVNNARRHSIYTLPADVQPGQRLLTLSTVSMASDTSMVLIFRSDRLYSDEYVEN